ncbi:MAG: tetratricopeptide repeat protein [Polyangiales bacterium]
MASCARPTMRTAVMLATLLFALPCAAQRDPSQESFERGVAAFRVRDYDAALRHFQEAYVVSRRPEYLFNTGLTFERLGRPADAVATLRQFLSLRPDTPMRTDVERRIAEIEATLPRAAQTPTPAQNPAPTPSPRVAVGVPTPPHPSPAPTASPSRSRPWWPWAVTGAGVVVAGAAVAVLVTAADPGADATVLSERAYLDAVDAQSAQRTAGYVLLGVAGATVLTGVVGLVLTSGPRRERAVNVGVGPLVGGASLAVSGRF